MTTIGPPRSGSTGRHRAGSVGPKITTPDAPTAAARCETPESLPTNADETRAIAATVGKSSCLRTGTPAAQKTGPNDISAGPRMTAMLARPDSSDASATNLFAGQFLPGLPLPGNITSRFEVPHFDCASALVAAAKSSGVGSSRGFGGKAAAISVSIDRKYAVEMWPIAARAKRMKRDVGVSRSQTVARENADRPKRRTSRCDRGSRRIGVRCPRYLQ